MEIWYITNAINIFKVFHSIPKLSGKIVPMWNLLGGGGGRTWNRGDYIRSKVIKQLERKKLFQEVITLRDELARNLLFWEM